MVSLTSNAALPSELLDALRSLIQQGRQKALRAVDMVQVQTCWEVGHHIVEFEQGGESRASYGKKLLPRLAQVLTREFGKGFDASNLRYMRLFYQAFPIRDALRHELSWTHYRLMLRVSDEKARQWYMNEAANAVLQVVRARTPDADGLLLQCPGKVGAVSRRVQGRGPRKREDERRWGNPP